MNTYQQKASTTHSRRRKAGAYATKAELAIYGKTIQRGGDDNLTQEDCQVLAGCRWLPTSLQRRYADMAQSVNWS